MKIQSRRKFIKQGLIAAMGLLFIDSFWFEKYMVKWNEYKLTDETDELKNISLIQLSDLHLKSVGYHHKAIAKKINELKPDLVLFTGDVIDDSTNIEVVKEFFNLIDKKLKKVAITGNWEYWSKTDLSVLKNIYNSNNCDFLINSAQQYQIRNRTLSLIGIDDFIGGNADYDKAIEQLPQSDSCIVLNHCPEYRDVIARKMGETKIDLVLSGHTHGGQITFFGYAPFKPPGSGRYLSGWYKDSEPKLYVSKGIGYSMLPLRLGARAEVAIFTI